MAGPWPSKFVGAHFMLDEPGKVGDSWNTHPDEWTRVRFDAVDVLFISPFFINTSNNKLMVGAKDDGNLLERFKWVVRAARSANENVKIILEQFYDDCPGGSDFRHIENSDDWINQYAASVAEFIEPFYNEKQLSLDGSKQVLMRIDGYDVDVESGTKVPALGKILTAVRASLKTLGQKVNGQFSVSITPAWDHHLNASMKDSCDYVNMQNYSGGQGTPPDDYTRAIPGLTPAHMAWGFASETPWTSTTVTFEQVKARVQEVANQKWAGTYTWRLNSNNYVYENMFQVWLYTAVHGGTLRDSPPESVVAKFWQWGGRENGKTGRSLE